MLCLVVSPTRELAQQIEEVWRLSRGGVGVFGVGCWLVGWLVGWLLLLLLLLLLVFLVLVVGWLVGWSLVGWFVVVVVVVVGCCSLFSLSFFFWYIKNAFLSCFFIFRNS